MYNRQSTTYNPFKKKRFGGAGWERLLAILTVVAIFGGAGLCVWQFAIEQPQNHWIGLAFMSFGAPLLIGGIAFLIITARGEDIGGCTTYGFLIVGLAFVVIGSLVMFAPDVGISQKVINIYQRGIQEKGLLMDIKVEPASYKPGDTGMITVSIQNNGNDSFILQDLDFDCQSKFFDGFIISYPTRPELKDRNTKIGGYTGLFFKIEPTELAPGESFRIEVDIVANLPGDYTSKFGMLAQVSADGKSVKLFNHAEDINVTIFPK